MNNILILYHSGSGNIEMMARQIARGVESIRDCQAVKRTVPTVSADTAASAPQVPPEGAPYVKLDDLSDASGLIMGSPTHFGNMSASLKHFIDQTTASWFSGTLSGKPAGVFTSTGSLHGGQESTLLSMMNPLLHHGMLIVGLPYSEQALRQTTTGGTPYGASHVSGEDGNNPLSTDEADLCTALGRRVASIAVSLSSSRMEIR